MTDDSGSVELWMKSMEKHSCMNCGYAFCRMLKRLDKTFKQMKRKTDCKEWRIQK